MKCQICGNEEAGYLCSVCNRVVCSNCKIIKDGKVFCMNHAPEVYEAAPKIIQQTPTTQVPSTGLVLEEPKADVKVKSKDSLKTGIYTVLVVLIGVILIYLITNFFLSKIFETMPPEASGQIKPIIDLINGFETMGIYIILILSIVLVVLIILFIKRRRKR